MRELWRTLRALARRGQMSRELEEEMRTHVEMRAQSYIDQGASAERARSLAQRRFGNRTITAEEAVEAWSFPRLETIAQDLRYGGIPAAGREHSVRSGDLLDRHGGLRSHRTESAAAHLRAGGVEFSADVRGAARGGDATLRLRTIGPTRRP
jgi:hypothetical protein